MSSAEAAVSEAVRGRGDTASRARELDGRFAAMPERLAEPDKRPMRSTVFSDPALEAQTILAVGRSQRGYLAPVIALMLGMAITVAATTLTAERVRSFIEDRAATDAVALSLEMQARVDGLAEELDAVAVLLDVTGGSLAPLQQEAVLAQLMHNRPEAQLWLVDGPTDASATAAHWAEGRAVDTRLDIPAIPELAAAFLRAEQQPRRPQAAVLPTGFAGGDGVALGAVVAVPQTDGAGMSFALLTVAAERLFGDAVAQYRLSGDSILTVTDAGQAAGTQPQVLYSWVGDNVRDVAGTAGGGGREWHLPLGERELRVSLINPVAGGLAGFERLPLAVFAGCLLITLAFAAYLQAARRGTREVSQLAERLEEKNAELLRRIDERDRMANALRESEQKYRTIFENAVEGVLRATFDGRFLDANRAAARLLGYGTPQELMASVSSIGNQLFVLPGSHDRFLQRLAQGDILRNFETEVFCRDGSVIWVSLTARAVRGEAGEFQYYEGMIEDVSERRSADNALRMAKEQADFANRAKSEFLANMSHELRTPLNAIIGFSEIIKEEMFGPVGQRNYVEYAHDIYDSGKLLLDLINDILDMSKIESGKRVLQEGVYDIGTLAASCIRLVQSRADAGGVELDVDIPDDLPSVCGEELSLKQILNNLLTNAIKFTPRGGRVLLRAAQEEDGQLLLQVRDTGIGIAPEDLPRALAPFGQIESAMSRKTQGTGLGLPLVQALVRLHDGSFHLNSTPGEGTEAEIRLPPQRLIRTQAA